MPIAKIRRDGGGRGVGQLSSKNDDYPGRSLNANSRDRDVGAILIHMADTFRDGRLRVFNVYVRACMHPSSNG